MRCVWRMEIGQGRGGRAGAIALIALVTVLMLVGWAWAPFSAADAATTLNTAYAFGWPSVSPSRVAAGNSVRLTISAQAKALDAPAVVTFVASAIDPAARRVELARLTGQSFSAWQTRRFDLTWPVPATYPLGVTRLRFELIDDAGALVAWREAALTVLGSTGGGSPAPAPTATATPRPVATPTPAPAPAGGHPVAISGSPDFVASVRAALDLMKARSATDYATVTTYVEEIREGSSNLAYVTSGVITIRSASMALATFGGSAVLHEAVHIRSFQTGQPYYGCKGEEISLRAQAAYLNRVGEPDLAAQILGLIGVWC
jgi:hypothetical protein